jgi:hypothetical protein
VPLFDASGSTIGLVNPASPASQPTAITYDPSGNPSSTSQGNSFPFLYQGMEHEFIEPSQYDYSGNGAFYSAQLMRGLSMVGAQGTKSPSGDAGSGGAGGDGAALNGMTNAAALAEQVAFQDPTEPGGASGPSGNSGDGGLILYWFEQFGQDLADLFGGGGGSDLPPNYYVFQHRLNRPHHGRHPLYTDIIGVSNTLIVDQARFAPPPKLSAAGLFGKEPPLGAYGGKVQLVQEVIPFEPEAVPAPYEGPDVPFDFSPRRPVTYARCLDAAEHPALWANLCRDMPNAQTAAACWRLLPESAQMKRGLCSDLFES